MRCSLTSLLLAIIAAPLVGQTSQPGPLNEALLKLPGNAWLKLPAGGKWTHLINKFASEKLEPRGSWAQNQVVYEPTLKAPVMIVGVGDAGRFQFDHEKREWKHIGITHGGVTETWAFRYEPPTTQRGA